MSLSVDITHRVGVLDLRAQFEAPPGVTALFGASGSGKTTIINAVAGLLRPDQGRVVLAGEPLFDTALRINTPPHKRRMGYVFQDGRLFPHLSVERNLRYGMRAKKTLHGRAPEFDDVVTLLGLSHLLNRRPSALSGGEKQRVAIGRALLAHPRLLLMDEPLAALDEPRKQEILPYLERLRDQTRIPILYVSHSVAEVARLATSVVMLEAGKTVQSGAAEDVLSDPANVRKLGIRQAGSVLPAQVVEHHPDGLTELLVSAGRLLIPQMSRPVGTRTRVRILAQDIILSNKPPKGLSALNILPAQVTAIREGTGPGAIVQLESGTDRLLVRITRRSCIALGIKPGAQVHAIIKAVSIAPTDVGAG